MDNILYLIPITGIIALIYVYIKNRWVSSKEVGNAKMAKIAKNISDGAMAFLKAEYKILSIFVILTSVLLAIKGINEGTSWLVSLSFVIGAGCSGLVGFIGIIIITEPGLSSLNIYFIYPVIFC